MHDGDSSRRDPVTIQRLSHPSVSLLALTFAGAWTLIAWLVPGFIKGDEVELLDAALRASGRSTFTPWSIRHTLLGDIIGGLWLPLWGAVSDPLHLVLLVTIPAIAGAAITMLLLGRVASNATDRASGRFAAVLYGLHWIPLCFATLPFPRAMTAPLVIGSALLAMRDTPWRNVMAGILIGLAGASRYSEWIFASSLLLLMTLRRYPFRSIIRAGLGFVAGATILILYDWHSHGTPGSTLLAFVDYTFIQSASSSLVKHQPWSWYLGRMHQILPPPLWIFLWLGFRDRRARELGIPFGILPLVVLSLVHHKELRYLQAALPFLILLTVAGFTIAMRRRHRPLYVTILVFGLVWNATQYRQITKRPAEPLAIADYVAEREAACVALMQPWRYGNTLYFPTAEIREITFDMTETEILERVEGCDHIVVFEERVSASTIDAFRERKLHVLRRVTMDDDHTIIVFGLKGGMGVDGLAPPSSTGSFPRSTAPGSATSPVWSRAPA